MSGAIEEKEVLNPSQTIVLMPYWQDVVFNGIVAETAQSHAGNRGETLLQAAEAFASEYASLNRAVALAVGADAIVTTRYATPVQRGGSEIQAQIQAAIVQLGDAYQVIHKEIEVTPKYDFPRDLFTIIGNTIFINNSFSSFQSIEPFEENGFRIIPSLLGEGGAVVNSGGKLVLVAESILLVPQVLEHVAELKGQGFDVVGIPQYYSQSSLGSRNRSRRAEFHINGHVAVIEATSGRSYLFCLRDYFHQDNRTQNILSKAIVPYGVVQLIHEYMLPPLGLNLFPVNGKVVIPQSGSTVEGAYNLSEFELILQLLVGEQNAIITDKRIDRIARATLGNVRCVANPVPIAALPIIEKLLKSR